jgi:hypothetical protein
MNRKYVRTKDGVYSTLHLTSKMLEHYKADIINQAETIEELCDEFVLIEHYSDREDIHHHYRDKKSFIEDYIGYEHIDIVLRCYTIYGCIWTDKGLIYVAKMNENGELELI